jgi:hypothetical protein
LGFSNRWYGEAVRTATRHNLGDGVVISVITAPCFLATKIEAFNGRGQGDILASKDVEDVIAVLDGRPELHDELNRASRKLQAFVCGTLASWLEDSSFLAAVEGYLLGDDDRIEIVLERTARMVRSKP